MTAESKDNEQASQEKLVIDDPSDFRFHAAYLAYSDVFDKMTDLESRKQLNDNIKALRLSDVDYQTFYRSISQFRSQGGSEQRRDRNQIRTQRKREWRKRTQRKERNKRYRK